MLLRSLETLELRMTRAGENAAKVCDFLRDHPKVESVGYLGFLEEAASRQADIYRRHCTGAGSTFSLYLKGGEREASPSSTRSRSPISRSASAAPRRSPARPAAMTHLSVPDERKAAARHHRQSGAHLDRRRGCRRPDRRFRQALTRSRRRRSSPSPALPSRAARRGGGACRGGSRRRARRPIRTRAGRRHGRNRSGRGRRAFQA